MLSKGQRLVHHPVNTVGRINDRMGDIASKRVPLEQIKGSSEPTLPHCLVADEGAQQRESDGRISDL
jgi:hypothetical protein